MPDCYQHLAQNDATLYQYLQEEALRQATHLELIASENYASKAVREAQGSIFTNKYAEGYPGRRYYAGCQAVDKVEQLAIDRAKQLFNACYANVQPHSGSQANAAVYLALLAPGETILGMGLPAGGHLTHGSPVSFSGQLYHGVSYGLTPQGLVDYAQVQYLAERHRPKLIIAGYSAYSHTLDWAAFRAIAESVGAYLLVDMAHIAGLVAANVIPSPVPHAHVVTCTTHKTLAGPRGGLILSSDPSKILHQKLNKAIFPGSQGGPLPHVIAAKAVAFKEASTIEFKAYQLRVIENARAMSETLASRGFAIVSGSTSIHMFLVDLTGCNLSGQEAEHLLSQLHLTLNKNAIPNDMRPPLVTSGIRIGTPAMTRRGMGKKEAIQVGNWIAEVLMNPKDTSLHETIKAEVLALCERFPLNQFA